MMTANRPGVTAYTTPTDTTVEIRRLVDAPRALVFEAWTSPKHMPQWLGGLPGWSMIVCEPATRPGQAWRLTWRKADGSEMTLSGVCREFTPPSRMVQTERWGPEWPETVNTVEFTEQGARTMIALTVAYPSKEARDAALKTGMKDGMDLSFQLLDQLLEKIA